MAKQLDLFDAPRVTSVAVSKAEGRRARNEAKPSNDQLTRREQEVFFFIRAAGAEGATSEDLEIALDRPKNKFSGRITSLVEKGLVFRKPGVRRGGCSVLFAKGHC